MKSTQHTPAPATLRAVRSLSAASGDSDPNADELLKRVRNPRSNPALRMETDVAYVLRDRQVADAARREIAEYAGVAA